MAGPTDQYGIPIGSIGNASKQFTITPHNTNNFDGTTTGTSVVARGILVNDTGPVDVAVLALNDTTAKTWKGLTAGYIIPVIAVRVLATGTSATDLLGLY